MASQTLEERVAVLEAQVGKLQDELRAARAGRAKDWRRAIEKYAGDDDLKIVFAEAMKLREADRKRARQRSKRGTKG